MIHRISSTLGMVCAGVLAAAVLTACGDEPGKTPTKVEEINEKILSSKIEQVEGKSTLTIGIKQDSIFSGGNTAKAVLAGVMTYFPSMKFDQVRIVMNEEMVDGYGKELTDPILELTYPRTELAKVNFNNVLGWNILNLAEVQRVGSHSQEIVVRECAEENNAKYAQAFCANALR